MHAASTLANTNQKASSKSDDDDDEEHEDVTHDHLVEVFNDLSVSWESFYYATPICVIKESRKIRQYKTNKGFLNDVEIAVTKALLRTKHGVKFTDADAREAKLKAKMANRPLNVEESNPESPYYVDVFDYSAFESGLEKENAPDSSGA
jgi:hypothetical protein